MIERTVRGIAEAEGVEPRDLDIQLQRHISTGAIRRLVNHESDSWSMQFQTPNHVVEITKDNDILVDGERKETLP